MKEDLTGDNFYDLFRQVKAYYQNLLREEINSDVDETILENIDNINNMVDNFKEQENKGIIELDERKEAVYIEMKELIKIYEGAGKSDQLDIDSSFLSKFSPDDE